MRLVKAACLLHDVSWRAHPDYRAEVCFDAATRANLGGMTHSERVFLGVALLHRYKSNRGQRLDTLIELLSPKEIRDAEILGRAMRFGAMLSVEDTDQMGSLEWRPKRRELKITVSPDAPGLFGEVAAARFRALAGALDATPIVIGKD